METPKIYFPYCPHCDEWTRPHRVESDVYCSRCGVWCAELPQRKPLPFGKHKYRNVYGMTSPEEKGYLLWFLENIERIDLQLRLAILFRLDYLPNHYPSPVAAPWWATHLSLSLPFSATQLKSAYRIASKKYHPDAGGSTEQMQRLNEAKQLATSYLASK